MRWHIAILFLIAAFVAFYSCTPAKTYTLISSEDYKKNWQYFELKDTLKAEIIMHKTTGILCGHGASASISIVKTGNDTIRILNLCNLEKYDTGQMVYFIPAEKPAFNVSFPSEFEFDEKTKNVILHQKLSSYDHKILKTAWGYAIR